MNQLHRPQRLRRAETPPGARTHLLPARHGRLRQGRRGHLLLHLRMVLPRQGADHQIQPETRVDHGTRTPVLEPHAPGVLPRVRPVRPRTETHGQKPRTLSTGIWWYATAYAIFLMLLPFLSKGLKALGREYHLAMAIIVLAIWGSQSFIPGLQSLPDNFLGFIYAFILISAYKWYMKPFTTKQIWLMVGIGLGFFLLYAAASATLSLLGTAWESTSLGHGSRPSSWWASACSCCSTVPPSTAVPSTG